MRQLPFSHKTPAWAVSIHLQPLPEGITHRSPVRFIRRTEPPKKIVVRDNAGKEWSLDPLNIDTGFEYPIQGIYYPESHPAAQEFLMGYISAMPRSHPGEPPREDIKAAHRFAIWILERNGVRVPDSLKQANA